MSQLSHNLLGNKYTLLKENYFQKFKTSLKIGNPNSQIQVELYSDYACPMCFAYNIMIHKAVKELGNVHVKSYNVPLDKECNKYLRKQVHKGACQLSRYAIAAKNQGKYWDMTTLLFEHKPKNIDEAIVLAQKLNLNIEQFKTDIKSKDTSEKINNDINYAVSKGIVATPAIIIDNKAYIGIKPYYELTKILTGKMD